MRSARRAGDARVAILIATLVYLYFLYCFTKLDITFLEGLGAIGAFATIASFGLAVTEAFGTSDTMRSRRKASVNFIRRRPSKQIAFLLCTTLAIWLVRWSMPIIGYISATLCLLGLVAFYVASEIMAKEGEESNAAGCIYILMIATLYCVAWFGHNITGMLLTVVSHPTATATEAMSQAPLIGVLVPTLDESSFMKGFSTIMEPIVTDPHEVRSGSGWFDAYVSFMLKYVSPLTIGPRAARNMAFAFVIALQGAWWWSLTAVARSLFYSAFSLPYFLSNEVSLRYRWNAGPLGVLSVFVAFFGVPASIWCIYELLRL